LLFDGDLVEARLLQGLCRVALGQITEGLRDLAAIPPAHPAANRARQTAYLAHWLIGQDRGFGLGTSAPIKGNSSPESYVELAGLFASQAAYWLGEARKRFPQSQILKDIARSLPGGEERWIPD
jgi:hypothetical protein